MEACYGPVKRPPWPWQQARSLRKRKKTRCSGHLTREAALLGLFRLASRKVWALDKEFQKRQVKLGILDEIKDKQSGTCRIEAKTTTFSWKNLILWSKIPMNIKQGQNYKTAKYITTNSKKAFNKISVCTAVLLQQRHKTKLVHMWSKAREGNKIIKLNAVLAENLSDDERKYMLAQITWWQATIFL